MSESGIVLQAKIATLQAVLRECIGEMRHAGYRHPNEEAAERLFRVSDRAGEILKSQTDAAVREARLAPPAWIMWTPEEIRKMAEAVAGSKRAPSPPSNVKPASAMPPCGNWPGIVGAAPPLPEVEKKGAPGDFGANVSDALARQREIGGTAKADAMRVPSFEEREAERARMADVFRTRGIL